MERAYGWILWLCGLPGGFRPRKFERITMADGGTVCLSWTSTPVDGDSMVLLLPGINNDVDAGAHTSRTLGLRYPILLLTNPTFDPLCVTVRASPDEDHRRRFGPWSRGGA